MENRWKNGPHYFKCQKKKKKNTQSPKQQQSPRPQPPQTSPILLLFKQLMKAQRVLN